MKYLKLFSIILSLLIVVLVSGFLVLWYNLDILATPKILSSLQKKWVPEAQIEWDKISIQVSNQSFYKKTFELKIESPTCLQWQSSQVCIKEAHFIVPMTLKMNFDYEVEKALLVSNRSKIHLKDFISDSKEPADFNINEQLLTFRSTLTLILDNRPNQFRIDIQNCQLLSEKETKKIEFSIDNKHVNLLYSQPNLKIDAKGKWLKLSSNQVDLKLEALITQKEWALETHIDLASHTNGKNQISLRAHDKNTGKGVPSFEKVKGSFDLFISEEGSQLTINDLDYKPDYGFDRLIGNSCIVEFYSQEKKSTQWDCKKLRLSRFETEDLKKLKKEVQGLEEMVADLNIQSHGFLNEKNLFAIDKEKLAEFNLMAQTSEKGFLTLDFKTQVEFFQSEKKLTWIIQELDTQVKVNSFQKIVKNLEGSQWAIPMPFNTLDGEADVNIQKISSKVNGTEIEGEAKIILSGEGNQAVELSAQGTYEHSLNSRVSPHSLKAKVLIRKISFHLPPFDPLRGIPPVTQDSRIKEKVPRKSSKKSSQFNYEIELKSEKNDSIQIYYKHFEPFLTASLSGKLDNSQNLFSFKVTRAFDISYLRREVKIENFEVENNAIEKDKIYIDGRMVYEASGYLIFIDVLGDIESPRVKLSSQPSLSRDDIISLLIYKRTRGDLSASEKHNVGGADAALTDQAIGLLGIWAFASTPIESVYYNSQTQSYQALIGLPGDVKLSLGTDWESSQFVGLKKRLTSRWSIVTGYESGDEQGVGNIFLQREYSY